MTPRNFRRVILSTFLAAASYAVPGHAVIILEKGVTEPVRGYLVDANETRVIVDVIQANGEIRQRIFPRTSIEEIIQAVSPERLESLSSERPQDYRDYAEELAGKTNDPDAQRTAIRLYQIAAYLAPDKLGRSCLLGMVALARSSEEERKFRAAAYLLDPEHDRSVLRGQSTPLGDGTKLTDESRQQLKLLLRALRDGRSNEARTIARKSSNQTALRSISSVLTPADFADLRNGAPLPLDVMAKVIFVELSLDPDKTETATEEVTRRPASGWTSVLDAKATRPVPVVEIEVLTEFDPRECHYRNGKWVR